MLRIIHERRWNIYTFYGSAEIFQILFRLFIAAQQMTQPCQLALALCHHGCRQQCRSAAQILRPELCPVQLPHPAHLRRAACDLNVRAELSKLRHVQKAPLKMVSRNSLPPAAFKTAAIKRACASVGKPGYGAVETGGSGKSFPLL